MALSYCQGSHWLNSEVTRVVLGVSGNSWGFPGPSQKILAVKTAFIVTLGLLFSRCHVQLLMTPWTAAHQPSLSFSLLRLMSIISVMPSNHLILCWPPLRWYLPFPLWFCQWIVAFSKGYLSCDTSAAWVQKEMWKSTYLVNHDRKGHYNGKQFFLIKNYLC